MRIVEHVQIDQNGDPVSTEAESPPPVDPAGNGAAVCPPLSIATIADLTGPDAAQGIGIRNGIQLAVDTHNAANAGCQIQLKVFDTQGDTQQARDAATQILADAFTIGVIGPAVSADALATGAEFDRDGLVMTTASATAVELADRGWRTFFRGLANDGVQGIAVANYIVKQLGSARVCVVDDGTDYGIGLAGAVRETLGHAADPGCALSVARADDQDFSSAVGAIKGRAPDAVFFAGYYAEAASLVRQLRDGGVTARFISGDASKDPEFVTLAGEAARDAVLSCSCGPTPAEFAEVYRQKFGLPPGAFSAGAHDLGTILLTGIDSGARTRDALAEFVRGYDGQGLERRYQWADNGELTTTLVWIYQVQ